jgi:hypothetical protein
VRLKKGAGSRKSLGSHSSFLTMKKEIRQKKYITCHEESVCCRPQTKILLLLLLLFQTREEVEYIFVH